MRVDLFDYSLPSELIAQEPRPRGSSRLLRLDRSTGGVEIGPFSHFPGLLREKDLLVVNDTKVIPARLFGRRDRDGRTFELLLIRRLDGTSVSERWEALCKPGRKLRPDEPLSFGAGLAGCLVSKRGGIFVFELSGRAVLEAAEEIGVVPLPPYIDRPAGPSRDVDRQAYQTVFARVPGAVAAPTAGLHFTPEVLEEIERRGARVAQVTLAVGPGTFKPVKVDDTDSHEMDAERYEIPSETAGLYEETRRNGGRICAVGTTTVRTLESAVVEGGSRLRTGPGETRLFVTPGFRFQAVDALLTNFHLPRSTLLMLVSAFAGREAVLSAYERAKSERFLFYSYGDAMWID